jgi:hypothetical protein
MTQGLNKFLSRIQTDYEFYLLFRQNPQAALGPYHLSTQERAALSESDVDVGSDPRLPLRARPLLIVRIWTNTFSSAGFDAAAAARVEIKQSLAQLRDAGSLNDRLAVLETLMKDIG